METEKPFEILVRRNGVEFDTSQYDLPTMDEAIRIGSLLQTGGCDVIICQKTPPKLFSLQPDGTVSEI